MYGDIDSQDDSSCASNKSWDMSKDSVQEDQKNIVYNDAVDDDKIDNGLHLRNGLVLNNINDDNDNNYIEQGGVICQQDGQDNQFGGANHNPQAQNKYFGGVNELNQNNFDKGEEHGKAGNKVQNQGKNYNNHACSATTIADSVGHMCDPIQCGLLSSISLLALGGRKPYCLFYVLEYAWCDYFFL